MMEIERKWLIDAFPQNCALLHRAHIRQGYLCTAPVVRIRESVSPERTDYVLCFKGKGTLVREEIELPLDAPTFRRLEALIGRPLVTKDYRVYALPGGEKLEVSLVDEGLPGAFFYAEVEFASVEQARAFVPPAFLGAEKTESGDFSMGAYWNATRGGAR